MTEDFVFFLIFAAFEDGDVSSFENRLLAFFPPRVCVPASHHTPPQDRLDELRLVLRTCCKVISPAAPEGAELTGGTQQTICWLRA